VVPRRNSTNFRTSDNPEAGAAVGTAGGGLDLAKLVEVHGLVLRG